MKSIITIILLILTISIPARASKANSRPMAVTQPDGTRLMVRLVGDEHQNWYQTMDGALLVNDGLAYYVATIGSNGVLKSSGCLAHNIDIRSAQEIQIVNSQNKNAFFARSVMSEKSMSKASGYPVSKRCPHVGKVRIPVIMMQYPDLKFSYSDSDLYSVFDEYFNGTAVNPYTTEDNRHLMGYGSVKKYFLDASDGKLELEFELYGPYTSTYESAVYGNAKGLAASDALKNEAISRANKDIDFTRFDSDNDGRVDMVYVIYAGPSASIGDHPNSIWPHLDTTSYYADGKNINLMGMSNELTDDPDNANNSIRAGVGILCHELSHGLGMPDLYWTLPNAPKDRHGFPDYNNCGPEEWDLMDGAENLCKGIWPIQYVAWEKEAMGWLKLEELNEPANVTVYPLDDKERGKAYMVKNPNNSSEYYVIENFMSAENSWNYYYWTQHLQLDVNIPGLIITHIHGFMSDDVTLFPNNTYGKPRITILPADGFLLADYSIDEYCWYNGGGRMITHEMFIEEERGDPYPGIMQVTELSKYKNYIGSKDMVEQFPITDILVNPDRSISFRFMGGVPEGINDICKDKSQSSAIYTIDGRYVGNDLNKLNRGIYIQNGRKIVTSTE